MRRIAPLLLVLTLLASATPSAAANGDRRMWVGFQDDMNFRWHADRGRMLALAGADGATIVRATAEWAKLAPSRPADPSSSFDHAYRFADLDELVRTAQYRDLEVMLDIWGTPAWANGGLTENHAPTRSADLTAFAHALADRYSGTHPGLPSVRFYGIWNEPNLARFLSPQYGPDGHATAPATYAALYRAARTGIVGGNPRALVGIGETSARGGRPDAIAPGRFAQLLAQQRPRLAFDAWCQHPYPSTPAARPDERQPWPNIALSGLNVLESKLHAWFGRRVPLWITEYGYETRPQPRGVTPAMQAAYAKQALAIASHTPAVAMFVWFMMRDDPTSAWQSGLLSRSGAPKPAYAAFGQAARPLDMRNSVVVLTGGTTNPALAVLVRKLLANAGTGAGVRIDVDVHEGSRPVSHVVRSATLDSAGAVVVRPQLTVARGHRYRVTVDVTTYVVGGHVLRTITVVGR